MRNHTKCRLNKEDLKHLLSIAYKLPKLRELDLRGYTLTGFLSSFLPDPHPGLPELEELNLKHTELNKEDIKHLFIIAHKLPKLQELDLSHNTLKGCLSSFLPDLILGLPELEKLNMTCTELNKDDLQHLSSFAHKLPKLRELYLSRNDLKGSLSSFLPAPHPGLPELKELNLWNTKLNKEDLQHLTHLMQTHKLPGLERLYLDRNKMSDMETDVGHLIETCVTHHQRELWLHLWDNNLSEEFENKWEKRCAETNIELGFG